MNSNADVMNRLGFGNRYGLKHMNGATYTKNGLTVMEEMVKYSKGDCRATKVGASSYVYAQRSAPLPPT